MPPEVWCLGYAFRVQSYLLSYGVSMSRDHCFTCAEPGLLYLNFCWTLFSCLSQSLLICRMIIIWPSLLDLKEDFCSVFQHSATCEEAGNSSPLGTRLGMAPNSGTRGPSLEPWPTLIPSKATSPEICPPLFISWEWEATTTTTTTTTI